MGLRELYDVAGDSEAAMRLIISENDNNNDSDNEQSPQDEYNCLLLTALATLKTTTTNNDSDNKKKKEGGKSNNNRQTDAVSQTTKTTKDDNDVSLLNDSLEDARTIVRNSQCTITEDWILAYNRGLVLLSNGNTEQSIRELWSYLKTVVNSQSSSQQEQPPLDVACYMGFLILEGILTLFPTRMYGDRILENTKSGNTASEDDVDLRLLDKVLAWLTETIELTKPSQPQQPATDPQLKFLLNLYQSRVNFFERTTSDGSIRDKHMRLARKELKQAMEIFQHKLRPERADTSSLASIISGGSSTNEVTTALTQQSEQDSSQRATSPSPPSGGLSSVKSNANSQFSRILQAQNQSALNLKANAEQLKGNIKKSLVLCGEAQTSFHGEGSSSGSSSSCRNYYEAIHQNNLGIVYESSGKPYLALHAFSKAARATTENSYDNTGNNNSNFESDGTACPDVTLHILNNAALCAIKSRNYSAAYESYAIGLATSTIWRKRPRVWLRLSEACIGLNAKRKERIAEGGCKCSKVSADGSEKAKGILLTETVKSSTDDIAPKVQLPSLASPEDLKDIEDNALARARMALQIALKLFGEEDTISDEVELQSARLSLAYVCLEEKDFKTALEYSMMVLKNSNPDEATTNAAVKETVDDSPRATMLKRQAATARMYASEASALLGDPMASMKILVGDGKDDAFDRLSSDLGGVTIGMASTNAKAKSRLAKAQTMVRCSASVASASLGNLPASKQLAMSAQAMENSYMASREGPSQARKALIYCMLREGNHGAALTLLKSTR